MFQNIHGQEAGGRKIHRLDHWISISTEPVKTAATLNFTRGSGQGPSFVRAQQQIFLDEFGLSSSWNGNVGKLQEIQIGGGGAGGGVDFGEPPKT